VSGELSTLSPMARNRLCVRRVALGFSQRQLADLMGTSQSHISELERGEKSPTMTTLNRWARALRLRVRVEFDDPLEEGA
jgi:transcriptional regulator with XRE-family HTH domain